MRRGYPPRRRTRLRQVGGRGLARAARWEELKRQVRQRDGDCRARTLVPLVICAGWRDSHHVHPRGRGGKDELDNLVLLCRNHHDWVHDHPAAAEELGLLR